jgi:hypothetical protein
VQKSVAEKVHPISAGHSTAFRSIAQSGELYLLADQGFQRRRDLEQIYDNKSDCNTFFYNFAIGEI